MRYSAIIQIMARSVRKVAPQALRFFEEHHALTTRAKGRSDWVSNADLAIEESLLYHLRQAHPEYGTVTEEGTGAIPPTGKYWIIDPLDGTTNFIHGLPHFSIALALAEGAEVLAAVVHNPVMDELFIAEKGRGAFLNDRRIRVSRVRQFDHALVGTGFPVRYAELLTPYQTTFQAVLPRCADIRRAGSAALDLAYVAAGRLDGFWEMRLAPWDLAAGILMIKEAGGMVSDLRGEQHMLQSGDIIAGNPIIHPQLEQILLDALERPLPASQPRQTLSKKKAFSPE